MHITSGAGTLTRVIFTWRVQESTNQLNTSILWNGQWQLLQSYNIDCSPNACHVEAFVEIHSELEGVHPSWTGRINAQSLNLKKSGSFAPWDTTNGTLFSQTTPYNLCDLTLYTSWYVLSSGSC